MGSFTVADYSYRHVVINWTIDNVLSLKDFFRFDVIKSDPVRNVDMAIQADPFYNGEWKIAFDANHGKAGHPRLVRICIEHFNRGTFPKFHAIYKLAIVDDKGAILYEAWSSNGRQVPTIIEANYPDIPNLFVDNLFFHPKALFFSKVKDDEQAALGRRYRYIIYGKLHLQADIEVILPNDLASFPETVESQLTTSIFKLWESKKGADFVLESNNGKEILVHRSILVTRSEVFASMLLHDTKEKASGRCVVDDLNADILTGMCEFMYGHIPENLSEIAEKLLYAADKYELPRLKELCGRNLARSLTLKTAAQKLILAHVHSSAYLLEAVLFFITVNKHEFANCGGMDEILNYDLQFGKDLIRRVV